MHKVLVVDDERLECHAIKEILERNLGTMLQVRTAYNGQSAVETACLWKADLVLMDIEMPGMLGVDAAKKIKAHLPDCIVIYLTAYNLFEYALQAIQIGAAAYLLKPVSDEDVIGVVGEKLGLFQDVVPQGTPDPDAPADKTSLLMREVERYLAKNYMHNLSLETVAETVHLNPAYFSRLFKAYWGQNFIDHLTSLRIGAAKELLSDPSLSVREIGECIGYADPNYFVKLFKKKTGQTPTRYRELLSGGDVKNDQ
ncbi:response regulator transcription factor [Anaerotalea alkaliphila]|uniref:Stage 0 sporulation protein A homolog n=1 Tax=Anaerotalea alkaliphila TaxID=2662126 RepID=A0A7X5HY82_9FIRM|nr:response regulator [Anaerotalea alkaliphila]NDL68863.1 response regulator [Anaerotalea alkaliphila]